MASVDHSQICSRSGSHSSEGVRDCSIPFFCIGMIHHFGSYQLPLMLLDDWNADFTLPTRCHYCTIVIEPYNHSHLLTNVDETGS